MNQAKPEVKIMLDRERILRFDFNAMAEFEAITGKNYFKVNPSNLSATDLRALLYACLKEDDEQLTLKQAGKLISMIPMEELGEKIKEAIQAAVATKDEKAVPLAGSSPSGTG